ncbi:MAG: hypothetical protein AB7T74_07815 [Clostridia bacterium]|jgi:hypothetical protein
MKTPNILELYGKLVNNLSFSSELYKLRRELNAKIDTPGIVAQGPHSHPVGISRWFKKRRISIAESYVMVIRDLQSQHAKQRLRALRVMIDASFHSKTLDLPLNTARVQLALIKEAIKSRGNKRRQLELLQDFSVASHGQYQVIRRLLDELGIVELPETGERLKNLDAGWDEHVHDTATSGRKNPTQLLIDSFIKGISELTITYGSASAIDAMKEAIEAGRIAGIRVHISLEFSVSVHGKRFHFMAMLPHFKNRKELGRWFEENATSMKQIFEGLEKNQESRVEAVKDLLKHFNATARKEINADYPGDKLYSIPKLKLRELCETVPRSSVNRLHLGEFLYKYYKPMLFNRTMMAKVQRDRVQRTYRRKLSSAWEAQIAEERYARLRAEYRELSPDGLRQQFFSSQDIGDYQTVFTDLGKIKNTLAQAACQLKVLHPLEYGFDAAKKLLESGIGIIDRVEVYNMQDAVHRDPDEILALCRLLNRINTENQSRGMQPFIPVCGSDATGRNPSVPGMGFIREDKLTGKYRKRYKKRHVALPPTVSALVAAKGVPVAPDNLVTAPSILSMGKITSQCINLVGDEVESDWARIPPAKAIRYLNPGLVNFLYAGTGFVVAGLFVGPFYAFLWMFITAFRNSIADLVAGRGTRLSEWNLHSINTGNVARSLFWTGFSVPLLGFIKAQFDLAWPLAAQGILFEATKFLFISFVNGLYLATHNTLRGFDRKVIKANFFRSILSWPLATATAPLGTLLGIPSIVQAKIWSDFVAGIIEGRSKYKKIVALRSRDLQEIIPQIMADDQEDRFTAMLDLLYLFREEPRTGNSLRHILVPGKTEPDTGKEMAGCNYPDFCTAIMDDEVDRPLVDFILAQYLPEMATELLDLVSTTLPGLRDWLVANEKVFLQPVLSAQE